MKDLTWIISQYDQEVSGGIALPPTGYFMQPNYWMSMNRYQPSRNYPVYMPAKRNSELINSLLGLPKNMESVGK